MNSSPTLSLEQQFNLKLFASKVQNLTPEQAREILVELQRQMMIKDNLYQDLLKHYMRNSHDRSSPSRLDWRRFSPPK